MNMSNASDERQIAQPAFLREPTLRELCAKHGIDWDRLPDQSLDDLEIPTVYASEYK